MNPSVSCFIFLLFILSKKSKPFVENENLFLPFNAGNHQAVISG
jgi:hypothetical protein